MDNDRMIRFIDSDYNNLFFLKDGESILLTRYDGEKMVRPCTFLDECHTKVGYTVFHICEFAERMERAGTTYEPERPLELPDRCMSVLPSDGQLIFIEKGKKGYTPCGRPDDSREANKRSATSYNHGLHVVPQQEAAMLGGALYGWKSRAARTTSYDLRGNPIVPLKQKSAKRKEPER